MIFTLILTNKQKKKLRYLWPFLFILILQMRKEEDLNEELPTTTHMYNHETTWDHGGNRISSWWLGFQLCNLACHAMWVPLGGRDLPSWSHWNLAPTTGPGHIAGLWQCCWRQDKAPFPHKAAVEIQWANAYRMYLTQEGQLVNTNWIWVLKH